MSSAPSSAVSSNLQPAARENQRGLLFMRISLIVVWLGTALVSAIEHRGQSVEILAQAGIRDASWQSALIWSGLLADALIGLALWFKPGKASYGAALALMLVMTVIATMLAPSLWLHPLGPLLKNLPIAAMLFYLLSLPNAQALSPVHPVHTAAMAGKQA